MIKKIKNWIAEKGLTNAGLVIAALILWWFFPGNFFGYIGCILLGIFIGFNWASLKDLSDVDERIEEKLEEFKKELKI